MLSLVSQSEIATPDCSTDDVRSHSIYAATAAEAVWNYRNNWAKTWYREGADPNDAEGKYAFQRLRETRFTPKIDPKFKVRADDKFYAIGSCFARGLESALQKRKISVESAAPEFAGLKPANKERSGIGFVNKYNTYSILNELRWALDPAAVFPVESIAQVAEGVWFDPHTNPTLELAGFEETLRRRHLMQTVTQRIRDCRVVIVTLGLVEVWRDLQTNVCLNHVPVPLLVKNQRERYEFHLTSFAQNWQNLQEVHGLLSRYGHPGVQIVVTVSPVPLLNTFSTMDVVVANTYAKSVLRAVAQQWAAAHDNVDYFPSYEIVQDSDRAATWEPDLRHVRGPGADHIMELFLSSYVG